MTSLSAKRMQKKLMTPEERFALDCKEVIRPELAKVLAWPQSFQCSDRSLANNWYGMMFQPYNRRRSALVGCDAFEGRVRTVILTVVGYMTQHVEPGDPGQAKRARCCAVIQYYLENFRQWPWSRAMVRSWYPSKLNATGKEFIDPDLQQKPVAEQIASLRCLLEDMQAKIDWKRLATCER